MLVILGLVGLTILLVSCPPLNAFREFLRKHFPLAYKIVTCSLCVGFVIGVTYGLLSPYEFFNFPNHSRWYSLVYGGVISVISFVVDLLITYLELSLFIKGGVESPRHNVSKHTENK